MAQDLQEDSQERIEQYLEQLSSVLLADDYKRNPDALPPTPEDSTWTTWRERSGELPPDFASLLYLPFLPDALVLDEGGENIPVETIG